MSEFQNLRVEGNDGQYLGRIKDIYFDDATWRVRFLKLSLHPRFFVLQNVLITPGQVKQVDLDNGVLLLNLDSTSIQDCPADSSFPPVSRQYATLAYYGSPRGYGSLGNRSPADPHLRSVSALSGYEVIRDGEAAGTLLDLRIDVVAWQVRYLVIEEALAGRKVVFHIHPDTVQNISCSTARVFLRDLEPVLLQGTPQEQSSATPVAA